MKRNEGFTLIELLIVVAIIGIIAAIAVPGLMRARMSGNESSAIGSLRAINSAQSTYASSCAQGNYADSLLSLATPPAANQPAFISPDLNADGILKSGYNVTVNDGAAAAAVGVVTCNGTNAFAGYMAFADPQTVGTTGQRFFGTNTTGTIWQHTATLSGITAADTTGGGLGTPIQ